MCVCTHVYVLEFLKNDFTPFMHPEGREVAFYGYQDIIPDMSPSNPVASLSLLQVSRLKPRKDKSFSQSHADFMWKNEAHARSGSFHTDLASCSASWRGETGVCGGGARGKKTE